ncbi:MAG: alpha/beta hydrolase [Pyrinomonadaceae bacterium]
MLRKNSLRLIFGVGILLALCFSVSAQTNQAWIEGKLDSKLMKRVMPYRVMLPSEYESQPKKIFPVVYLLHGLTGNYKNWFDRTNLVEYSKNFDFILVTPEGENGWYTDSAVNANQKYESYLTDELFPEIETNYRAGRSRENRAIAGLSMGGYGSVKFAVKYPEKFKIIGAFSGALKATEFNAATIPGWRVLTDSVDAAFGDLENPARKANDVFLLTEAVSDAQVAQMPFFYVSCGTEDFLLLSNREYAALLSKKKIAHEFRELPGGHDWKFWNDQVDEFLRVVNRRLKQ